MGLGEKLRSVFDRISNSVLLDKTEIKEIIREIQRALISADVEVNLVLNLSRELESIALQSPPKGFTRKEFILKKTYELLVMLLGEEKKTLLNPKKIMLVGLFGAGKTTTAGKLGLWYKKRGKNPVLIAGDIHRPASFEQLQQVAKKSDITFYGEKQNKNLKELIENALTEHGEKNPLILDTAGRSALDKELVSELKLVEKAFKPDHTFLVLSADTGQLAKKQAGLFKQAVNLTGIILTKMDGSAKGGGALAACAEIRQPVYFIGVGENPSDLQEFDSKRFLSRILGYGDLQALLEKAREIETDLTPEELLEQDFNLEVFKKQLDASKKIGPLNKIAEMMGLKHNIGQEQLQLGEKKIESYYNIMNSMTLQEKRNPEIISKNRIIRIARGSGKREAEVRELLKQFKKMARVYKKMQKLTRNAKNLNPKQLEKLMKKFQPKKRFRWH